MIQSKSTLSDIAKLAKVSIKTASRVVRKEQKSALKLELRLRKLSKL